MKEWSFALGITEWTEVNNAVKSEETECAVDNQKSNWKLDGPISWDTEHIAANRIYLLRWLCNNLDGLRFKPYEMQG